MKKLFALVLAVAMLFSCAAFAEEAQAGLTKDLVILFTSDAHCGIDQGWGYAGVAAIRDYYAQNNHVILVDNGDAIQGEPVGTMTKGSALIDLMNATGYEVAIPGNHEFDYGMDNFLALAEKAEFEYVSANFNKEGEAVFAPYVIKEYDGVKVAFVGICTPRTITSSTPTYFQDGNGDYIYGFCQDETGEKLYAAVQTAVDAARGEGATYVIALAHLGIEAECSPWMSSEVIQNTTGITALLDGHSHSTLSGEEVLNKNGEAVLQVACGTKLANVGKLTIAKDGTISSGLHSWEDKVAAPALLGLTGPVADAVKAATAELDAALSEVVATSEVDLYIYDPVAKTDEGKSIRIIRSAETNLGDLCADGYRILSGADIAFVNGGGIRVQVPAGNITRNDILKVHPFGNAMCVIEVTGQQVLDALEFGARVLPSENGGFLQVSGLTYEIHTYIESSATTDAEGMFSGVTGEYRVKNVMVGGEPLDLAKTYTLASHNYMLKSAGDGFAMFKGCKLLQDEVMLDNQVLITYITDVLGGVVGEAYANPYGEGRIVAVEAPAN